MSEGENQAGDTPAKRIKARRKARHMLIQALYQRQISGASLHQIEAEFRTDHDMSRVDGDFFSEALRGITTQLTTIDELIANVVKREIASVDPIELAVARLGTWELRDRLDVPWRVVINEAVELVKKFGGTEGHRFINSVLDKLAMQLRAAEIRASGGAGTARRRSDRTD